MTKFSYYWYFKLKLKCMNIFYMIWSIFIYREGNTILRCIWYVLNSIFVLRRYHDSIDILKLHRVRLLGGESWAMFLLLNQWWEKQLVWHVMRVWVTKWANPTHFDPTRHWTTKVIRAEISNSFRHRVDQPTTFQFFIFFLSL